MATLRANTNASSDGGARSPGLPHALAAALILAALAWSFYPSFVNLVGQWNRDPNYSYGFFVIPIALAILWSRRDTLDPARARPHWWGFLPLVAVLAARYPLFEWNEQYIETATIPLVVGSLIFALGGWHLLRVAAPAVLFLGFMLPLPPSLNQFLAAPLQKVATAGSVALLQIIGLPVMAEGNVIVVGSETLEVARACNGLSMLLSFVTLITATVLLVKRPILESVLLLLSAVPIALVTNILRITVTALVYYYVGHDWGEKLAHDAAGWMMMPIALGLVWLELKVLTWLFVEVETVDMTRFRRPGAPPPSRP